MSLVNVTKAYSETVASSDTWVIKHNLQTDTPVVDIYNGSNVRIMPEKVFADNENQLTIRWSAATAGRVYVV